ncbi:MAG: ABC transporter permease [Vicinamibacterales bacterium]
MTRAWPAPTGRIAALVAKELAELRQNPSVFVPAIITALASLVLPFFVAVIVPAVTGERLSDSSDFEAALELYRLQPGLRHLDPETAVQAWVFQQFLILLLLTPVAGSMSVAAYSVIGEKQARTLEPLLATPIRTVELLAAKVLGSLIPALVLTLGCFALYVGAVVVFARPGAYLALLNGRSLAVVFVLGPLAALAALQLAVCVSSRVNDARSAQQIGALVILPIAGLLVAQITGSVVLTGTVLTAIAIGLVVVNAGLLAVGVALFDRESILTRWT